MAQKQKRPSLLDEPPTASSFDLEEDQQPSSQQHEEEEDNASSEESLSEEEEEQHKPSTPLPLSSKTPPPPPSNSHPKPSSSESGTGYDSGSDSELETPAAVANPKVKPSASKPMEQTLKAKPQPSASVPTKSGSKHAPENNMHMTDRKRSKNKVTTSAVSTAAGSDEVAEEDGKKSGDELKKLFQRLWGEEDEIAILEGMVKFTSKTGMDPYKQANEFYDFVKKSLRADASSNQLKEKIRRLKKKFKNQAGKGKNGEDPKFPKAHDRKMFELSKKIWGDGEGGVPMELQKRQSLMMGKNLERWT